MACARRAHGARTLYRNAASGRSGGGGSRASGACCPYVPRSSRTLTIGALLRQLRITRACFLLGKSDLSLAQLALDLGFSDQSQFTKTFRRMTGMTPAR